MRSFQRFSDILLDSVNVSWTPPSEPNGLIQAYTITYRTRVTRNEFRREIIEKTTMPFLLVARLNENTTYEFAVAALTAAGAGAESYGNVTIGYNDGAPAAPTRPLIVPEESAFALRWTDTLAGRSPIRGHLIQAKRIGVVRRANATSASAASSGTVDFFDTADDNGDSGESPDRRRRRLHTAAATAASTTTNGEPHVHRRRRRQLLPPLYDDPFAPHHPVC